MIGYALDPGHRFAVARYVDGDVTVFERRLKGATAARRRELLLLGLQQPSTSGIAVPYWSASFLVYEVFMQGGTRINSKTLASLGLTTGMLAVQLARRTSPASVTRRDARRSSSAAPRGKVRRT